MGAFSNWCVTGSSGLKFVLPFLLILSVATSIFLYYLTAIGWTRIIKGGIHMAGIDIVSLSRNVVPTSLSSVYFHCHPEPTSREVQNYEVHTK